MTKRPDDLDDIVNRLSAEDPVFRAEYDRRSARAEVVLPIIQARLARGWSQRELARVSGVQQPVIARLEAGDTDPRLSTLTRISHALELRFEWVASSHTA